MQVTITGRHVAVTPAIKSFINEKLGKLGDLFPKAKKIQVVLSVEKYRHSCELHFHADGMEFSSHKTTKDMYASVEACLSALQQQTRRRKEKLRSQHSRRRRGVAKRPASGAGADEDEGFPIELEKADLDMRPARRPLARLPRVVKMKAPGKGPLREEEAARELVESGKDFLVYEDSRTGRAHVLYKREDGTLGLVEA